MNTSISDLCKAKQMKGRQRKMEVYTVSCHGGQLKCVTVLVHTLILLIPQFLSSHLPSLTIHPFTRLYLCFSDEEKKKALNHLLTLPPPTLSPHLFRQGSQAWLAIVTWPHGGKIGTCTHRREHVHTQMHVLTHNCGKEDDKGQFSWVWSSLEQGTVRELGGGGEFCLF